MPESTATLSVEAAGQVYNQTNEFVYLGENVSHNADRPSEVDRRIRNAWCSSRKYAFKLYDRPSAPLELELRMLRVEVLEATPNGCVTCSPRACHYNTLHRAHHRLLTRCIGWLSTIAPTTQFPIWIRLSRLEMRASRRVHAGGGSCLRDLWRAWRIRDCRSA